MAFINGFFGYGDLEADIWFIGMEEGGGDSIENIEQRLSTWVDMGNPVVADMFEYHKHLGLLEFFSGEEPKLQTTWKMLARYILSFEGSDLTTDMVRQLQSKRLGRAKSNTCLLELLPLPSPSTNHWHYSSFSDLPELQSREAYKEAVMPKRIVQLNELISKYQPKKVVFYGKTYAPHWMEVVGCSEGWKKKGSSTALRFDKIDYEIRQHPAAFGVRNSDFECPPLT